MRTHRRDATLVRWLPKGISATADGNAGEGTWLREALFDRQIVDLDGQRVIRIGDVVLRGADDLLEVAAVEVGAAAVLRRLGLARLAARLEPQQLPIDRLHVPNVAAGGLLLDAPPETAEATYEGTWDAVVESANAHDAALIVIGAGALDLPVIRPRFRLARRPAAAPSFTRPAPCSPRHTRGKPGRPSDGSSASSLISARMRTASN